MKLPIFLFTTVFLGFISCKKEEVKPAESVKDSIVKNDSAVINPMAHVMDSATTSGQTFSAIKNAQINLKEDAIILKSVNELTTENAYLVLNDDQSEAEVFLPNAKDGFILKRNDNNGVNRWTDGAYQLIKTNVYSFMTTAKEPKPLFNSDSL